MMMCAARAVVPVLMLIVLTACGKTEEFRLVTRQNIAMDSMVTPVMAGITEAFIKTEGSGYTYETIS